MNVILQPGDTLFVDFGAVTGTVVIEYDLKHNAVVATRFEGQEPTGDDDAIDYADPTNPRAPESFKVVARQGS